MGNSDISIFPHILEYHRLGRSSTDEGREYLNKHQDEFEKEYDRYVDVKRQRNKLGGNRNIHTFKKLNNEQR